MLNILFPEPGSTTYRRPHASTLRLIKARLTATVATLCCPPYSECVATDTLCVRSFQNSTVCMADMNGLSGTVSTGATKQRHSSPQSCLPAYVSIISLGYTHPRGYVCPVRLYHTVKLSRVPQPSADRARNDANTYATLSSSV